MSTITPRARVVRNGKRALARAKVPPLNTLPKCPTGIVGFDVITHGGLPRGRPTLICGGPGCGKTLFATEFLVRGATEYDEPGVFVAFEETADDLTKNAASLGFDLDKLVESKKLVIDYVQVEHTESEETGDFDLDGLFIRLGHAIDSVDAKRVVLDTLEVLYAGLPNPRILRSELRRLFGWLKDRGMTAIVTAERGEGALTRHGLEEYVSDCVVSLDHRVIDQISTRRLRILKYRGSTHDTNEVPYLIDQTGFSVLPISTLSIGQQVLSERVSTGVADVDVMLGGQGWFQGSSILISGTAGSGKSSLAAHFAAATCKSGGRCIYFPFEESSFQIIRNMRSIGLDLKPWEDQGLLQFHASRPTSHGLELHLTKMCKAVSEFAPDSVIIDPISNLINAGTDVGARLMLMRLMEFLRARHVTTLMTILNASFGPEAATDYGISSMVDTWLLLRELECNGERNRSLSILKSRGMAHSNQVREIRFSGQGIQLEDVYVGPEGVLLGSSKATGETRRRAAESASRDDLDREQRARERRLVALEAQISALRGELEAEREDIAKADEQDRLRRGSAEQGRVDGFLARAYRPPAHGDGPTARKRKGSTR